MLVEDDSAVAASIRRRLAFEGFEVTVASNSEEALEGMKSQPALLILDVMLPGRDGFHLAEQIRETHKLPIMMLTARGSLEDRITGLEVGADDYIVKPFELPELLARIRALLRRARRLAAPDPQQLLVFGDLRLDLKTREVFRGQRPLHLTPREFQLLLYFLRHPGIVLERERLLERVWGYDHEGSSNLVDVYIRQLREKMESDDGSRLLQTIRGVGYVLREY